MTFKNLKIAITDETHLKAVCEVLESIGYRLKNKDTVEHDDKCVICFDSGSYFGWWDGDNWTIQEATLSDLLKMRDDMVKANAKSSQT